MIDRDIEKRITDAGFELARSRKHLIWKDAEGRTLVTANSPSDHRAGSNILRDLDRVRNSTPWATATATPAAEVSILAPQPKKKSASKSKGKGSGYSGVGVVYYKSSRPVPSEEVLESEREWNRLRDRLRADMFEFEKELQRIWRTVYEEVWHSKARWEMARQLCERREDARKKVKSIGLVAFKRYIRSFIRQLWRKERIPKFPLAAMLISNLFDGEPVLEEEPTAVEERALDVWRGFVTDNIIGSGIPDWLMAAYDSYHSKDEEQALPATAD